MSLKERNTKVEWTEVDSHVHLGKSIIQSTSAVLAYPWYLNINNNVSNCNTDYSAENSKAIEII
jgi:hypothetical protein